MYHIDNGPDVLHRCMLQDAMAQVEYVSRAAICAAQDIVDALFDLRQRCEEHSRVQIALHRDIAFKQVPALIEWDAPVESDNVSTGALHQRQQGRRVCPEVNYGDIFRPGCLQHSLRIGQDKTLVILRAEGTYP